MKDNLAKSVQWIVKLGYLILFASIFVATWGYLSLHRLVYTEIRFHLLQDFYANLSTELFSVAVTILIVNKLYENQATEEEKKRLILQMGSPDNAFAIEAVRQLCARKWLQNGFLQGANLEGANLEGADLTNADLKDANLLNAILKSATLEFCDLSGAYLPNVDFSGAKLQGVNFENANLTNAKFVKTDIKNVEFKDAELMLANFKRAWIFPNDWAFLSKDPLSAAKSLRGAILPKGKRYMGSYTLLGDIEDAKKNNIDTSNPTLMKEYYQDGFQPTIYMSSGHEPRNNWAKKRFEQERKKQGKIF